MAVGLSDAGQAIVYKSVPWAHSIFSLKKRSFPKGAIPAHLRAYLFSGEPRQCASETARLRGAARIYAMNSCISRAKGGRRGRVAA